MECPRISRIQKRLSLVPYFGGVFPSENFLTRNRGIGVGLEYPLNWATKDLSISH